jgi:chromate transport protein ChrA
MASTDTIMGVMFALSGIVIVVGLVIHYARESRTKPAKPRSTLSGVIQLLMIVVGLMVAIAVIDFVAMSIGGGTPGAIAPVQWR